MADFTATLPGYEGPTYDGDLEATIVGDTFDLTLITHNPNYGGGSGLGRYTLAELEVADLLDGRYPDVVADLRAWARRAAARP